MQGRLSLKAQIIDIPDKSGSDNSCRIIYRALLKSELTPALKKLLEFACDKSDTCFALFGL